MFPQRRSEKFKLGGEGGNKAFQVVVGRLRL